MGVTDGSEAGSGQIGEFLLHQILAADAIPLTSEQILTVATIDLPAGDWDVRGQVDYAADPSTIITYVKQGVSRFDAQFDAQDTYSNIYVRSSVETGVDIGISLRPTRLNIATPTTVYLVCMALFVLSTMSAYGYIGARRAR